MCQQYKWNGRGDDMRNTVKHNIYLQASEWASEPKWQLESGIECENKYYR